MSRARRRDRRVYLAGHPVLFVVLALVRRRGVLRLGRTVIVNDPDAYAEALMRLPLDRMADGSTGGAAQANGVRAALFDQDGEAHRRTRRMLAADLGEAGVDRLRTVWTPVLDCAAARLAGGERLDVVTLAAELAGVTTCALLSLDADPLDLARAAHAAAAATARTHLPGLRCRRRSSTAAEQAVAELTRQLGPGADGLTIMTAVAAVNTTMAGLPRAVAWCADLDLWRWADRPSLSEELLRVTAPSPLLPRVAAADGTVGGCPVRTGDRLVLMARHAAAAHREDPDPGCPASARQTQLVFGVGPHACPGARLARAQLSDTMAVLAPLRPVVVRARADRRAGLPGWATLQIEAGALC